LGFVPMGKPYKGIVTDVQLMTLAEWVNEKIYYI
jgi:hypothetical protein